MEKETTGLYLTGHPMDEYRAEADRSHAVRLGAILGDFSREDGPQRYRDGQSVTIAGVIASAKTKTTKNNSLMAYVTLEDDTGSMELLVFSRVLSACGPYLRANTPILVTGKISVRDEKEPQLLVDSVRVMGEGAAQTAAPAQGEGQERGLSGKKLYVKLNSDQFPWLRKLFQMFPGEDQAVIYFADTQKRKAASCILHTALVDELTEKLGGENVVLK